MVRKAFLLMLVLALMVPLAALPVGAEEALQGVCLTEVPEEGCLMLGTRVLRAGDVLTSGQAAEVTFLPADAEADLAVTVGYLPVYGDGVAQKAEMVLHIKGRENKPPVAEDSAGETYKNLELRGKLKVTEPEGEALSFTIVRQPRRGELTIERDGSFVYQPKKNKVGIDSFVYTATDASGKVSREATVTVEILKPTAAAEYRDTLGRECRFAAEWMKHSGIFVGETLGEERCFGPEKPVSRGEFLVMAVKALGLETEEQVRISAEVPQWLAPYVAAAMRSGMAAAMEGSDWDAVMECAEAEAVMVQMTGMDVEFGEGVLTRELAALGIYESVK